MAKVRSTKSQIEEFKKSFIWKDIKDELRELGRKSQIEYGIVGEPHIDDQGAKIVPNTSETLIHLGDIKGRIKAINYFLNIPDILIQLLSEGKEEVSDGNETE